MKGLVLMPVGIALAAGAGGCATYEPVLKDYAGPIATVMDTGAAEDGTKADLFSLVEIDVAWG